MTYTLVLYCNAVHCTPGIFDLEVKDCNKNTNENNTNKMGASTSD